MRRRLETCGAFETSLPDDTRWDENDELVVPGGGGILTFLATFLRREGFEVLGPSQYSHFGWEMEVKRGRVGVRLVLQFIDPWLLIMEGVGGVFTGGRRDSLLREITALLEDYMVSAPEFSRVVFGSRRYLIGQGYRLKER